MEFDYEPDAVPEYPKWHLSLLMTKASKRRQQEIQPLTHNAIIILRNAPEFDGLLGFDEMAQVATIMREPAYIDHVGTIGGIYPRPFGEAEATMVTATLQARWTTGFNTKIVADAMLVVAKSYPYHRLRDWLLSLSTPAPDTPRFIDTWLTDAFQADDTPLTRAIGRKVLIASVARVLKPGCKVDTMMILEGPQGIGKSEGVRITWGPEYYSAQMVRDLDSRDASIAMRGKWVFEFAEIEHLIRADIETIKAFLTRQVEDYKPMYGRTNISEPRTCVFVGTTNATDYLRDPTGNRRFWSVRCRAVDLDWLHMFREHMWAEAVAAYQAGETWWIDDEVLFPAIAEAQAERVVEDTWSETVERFVNGKEMVALADVIMDPDALSIPRKDVTRGTEIRVSAILRRMGWSPKNVKIGGRVLKKWTHEIER